MRSERPDGVAIPPLGCEPTALSIESDLPAGWAAEVWRDPSPFGGGLGPVELYFIVAWNRQERGFVVGLGHDYLEARADLLHKIETEDFTGY